MGGLPHQRIYQMCMAHGFAPEIRHEVRHWLSVLSLANPTIQTLEKGEVEG